jgi:hypothetical protein
MTFGHIFTIAVGVLEWIVAIASVVGTLGLAGWILKMIVKDERTECKPDRAQQVRTDKPDELH